MAGAPREALCYEAIRARVTWGCPARGSMRSFMISSPVENFNESGATAGIAQARWPRRAATLASLETVALVTLLIELCLPAQARVHAGNAAPLWFRILS